MKAILLKDYLEQRMYFVIILAVAALSLLVAAFFGQLDSGVALVILFVMQAPLFVYMAANHQISAEVNNGTWHFLSALPVSRLQLWGAKLIFAAIYTVILYTMYFFMAILAGVNPVELYNLVTANPGLTLGLPVVLVATGFFTTMLPPGFSTITWLVLAPIVYAIFKNESTMISMNYLVATLIISSVFLVMSLVMFYGDRSMNSPWRGIKGLGVLACGIMLMGFGWLAIDRAAERFWAMDYDESSDWMPLNDGKSIVWRIAGRTPAWDNIQPKSTWASVDDGEYTSSGERVFDETDPTRRLLILNTETGSVKQIGQRLSSFSPDKLQSSNGLATVYLSRINLGFFRGHNYGVIDQNGTILKTLPTSINEYSHELRIIDDNRFIYSEEIKAGNNLITEFHLYEKGRGTRVVFSAAGDFAFNDYLVIPALDRNLPGKLFITGQSDHEKDHLMLINSEDGKKSVLPVPPMTKILAACPDYLVIDNGRWNKGMDRPDKKLMVARFDGSVMPLNQIASDAQIVGISATGQIIAMIPGKDELDWYLPDIESIVEVDPRTGSSKELQHFNYPGSVKFKMNRAGDFAIVHYSDTESMPARRQLLAINLLTGTVAPFSELNTEQIVNGDVSGFSLFSGLFSLNGSRFMLEGESSTGKGGIFELDAASAKIVRHLDYTTISKLYEKWGAKL